MSRLTLVCCLLLLPVAFDVPAENPAPPAAEAGNTNQVNPELLAIQSANENYAKAFNAGDATALAQLYAETAELIVADGTTFRGRETIQAEFAAFFKQHPQAALQIRVDRIAIVAPQVAIEEGLVESRLAPDTPAAFSEYVAVYAKVGPQWLISHVQEKEVAVDSGERLKALDWLIGQWIDEAPESKMKIDCYWHESGAYLIRDFEIEIAGLLASRGTERIGWDPVQKKIRSWLFDAEGGYLEGTWVKTGDHWTIATQGFRPDGVPTTATYAVTPLREDAYFLSASSRTAGEAELEDFEMTVVKRPPAPGNVPALKAAQEPAASPEKTKE